MSGAVASAYAEVGFKDTGVAAGLEALNHKLHGWQTAFVAVMAGGVIGEAVRGFIEKIHGIAESLDRLRDRARETRTPIEQLSQIEFAGKLNGIENVSGMLNHLTRSIGEAAEGNAELSKSFQNLGIDAGAFMKSGRPAADLMGYILDKLHALPAASAHALAMSIFGRSGFEVMRFGTGTEYRESIATANRAGATVTQQQADAADKLIDELHIRAEKFNAIWRSSMLPVLEAWTRLLEKLNEGPNKSLESMMRGLGDGIATVVGWLPKLIDFLDDISTWIADNVSGQTGAVGSAGTGLGSGIPLSSVPTGGVGSRIGNWINGFSEATPEQMAKWEAQWAAQRSGGSSAAVAVAIAENTAATRENTAAVEQSTPIAGTEQYGGDFGLSGMIGLQVQSAKRDALWRDYADSLDQISALSDKADEMARLHMPAMTDVGSYWSTAQQSIVDDVKQQQAKDIGFIAGWLREHSADLLKQATDADKRQELMMAP